MTSKRGGGSAANPGFSDEQGHFEAWRSEEQPVADHAISALRFVLDSRRHVALFAVGGLLASLAVAAVWVIQTPTFSTYKSAASLTMKSARNGEYPNGAVFSPSDLRSPSILRQVYEQYKLADFGLSFQAFSSAVVSGVHAPQVQQISERYRLILADRNLTPEERKLRSDEYASEIEATRNSGVFISLTLDSGVKLSDEIGKQIADSILQTWSSVYVGALGVAGLPVAVSRADLVRQDFVKSADFPVAYDYLNSALNELHRRIDELSKLPGVNSVVLTERAKSLYDIKREADNLRTFEMNLILAPIVSSGLSRQSFVTALAYDFQARSMRDNELSAARQTEVISGVIVEGRGEGAAEKAPAESGGAAPGVPVVTSIPQFGDTLVDRIVQMSVNGSGKEFREKLLNDKLDIANRSLASEKQRREVERRLDAIRKSEPTDPAVRAQMTETFQSVSASVADQLNGLWKDTNVVLAELSADSINQDKLLYTPLPLAEPVIRSTPLTERFLAPLVGGLTVLGALAGFAAYVIQLALRRRIEA